MSGVQKWVPVDLHMAMGQDLAAHVQTHLQCMSTAELRLPREAERVTTT